MQTFGHAYLCEELCSNVSDGVTSDGRQGTFCIAECMANTKWLATWAICVASLHPNLRQRASLKACLDMGMAVSHAETPFSLACSIALCPATDSLGSINQPLW